MAENINFIYLFKGILCLFLFLKKIVVSGKKDMLQLTN